MLKELLNSEVGFFFNVHGMAPVLLQHVHGSLYIIICAYLARTEFIYSCISVNLAISGSSLSSPFLIILQCTYMYIMETVDPSWPSVP